MNGYKTMFKKGPSNNWEWINYKDKEKLVKYYWYQKTNTNYEGNLIPADDFISICNDKLFYNPEL